MDLSIIIILLYCLLVAVFFVGVFVMMLIITRSVIEMRKDLKNMQKQVNRLEYEKYRETK